MNDTPIAVRYRDDGRLAAIVLIHGFGGDARRTWAQFPQLLLDETRLKGWDVYSLGYSTRLRLDLGWLWQRDPPIADLAELLRTALVVAPLARYDSVALIAHSMGGIVAQRALVDDPDLADRVRRVVLFGTPSDGVTRGQLFAALKAQVRDLLRGGAFISDLRRRWTEQFAPKPPFAFLSVAGDKDDVVPRWSSIDLFPAKQRAMVPGNHSQIVKPVDANHQGYQVAVRLLVAGASLAGPRDSANLTIEERRMRSDIKRLWPQRAKLDDKRLVDLGIALDTLDRRDEAIELLETYGHDRMDPMGVLAGRLKRRWLAEGRREDAERAKRLYARALELAVDARDPEQVNYHGINVAFLTFFYENDRERAARIASDILANAGKAPPSVWRPATEAEAHLLIGNADAALGKYREALDMHPQPWEVASMLRHAEIIVGAMRDEQLAKRLEALFQE